MAVFERERTTVTDMKAPPPLPRRTRALATRANDRVLGFVRTEPVRAGLVALGLGLVVGRLVRMLVNRLRGD